MVIFQVDTNEEEIRNALKSLDTDADRVLKNAINRTARKVRKDLAKEAKRRYVYKDKSNFYNEMKLRTAKKVAYGSMMAEISAKGEANEIVQFRVGKLQVSNGKKRPKAVKGKVMKTSKMTALKSKGIKAFVAQFRSGHIAVVVRDYLTESQRAQGHHARKSYKYANYRLKKLLSPSVPQMLGNEEALNEIIEPEIQDLLRNNIAKQFDMIMKKKTRTGK